MTVDLSQAEGDLPLLPGADCLIVMMSTNDSDDSPQNANHKDPQFAKWKEQYAHIVFMDEVGTIQVWQQGDEEPQPDQ